MIIKEYRGAKDIDVYFPEYDCLVEHRQYSNFDDGHIKCPYEAREFGIGYRGEGIYRTSTHKKAYETWKNMLGRCYDKKYHKRHPSYIDCKVCNEWLNFQNFAKWYEENYYEVEGEKMCLDKDILVKDNKVYSPDTCVFVPQRINLLFVKNNKNRGDLPIGVNKVKNKYIVRMNDAFYLKYFDTPHEAFLMYKINKELLIEGIANEYENKVPNKLYNALINYEVEIKDLLNKGE